MKYTLVSQFDKTFPPSGNAAANVLDDHPPPPFIKSLTEIPLGTESYEDHSNVKVRKSRARPLLHV